MLRTWPCDGQAFHLRGETKYSLSLHSTETGSTLRPDGPISSYAEFTYKVWPTPETKHRRQGTAFLATQWVHGPVEKISQFSKHASNVPKTEIEVKKNQLRARLCSRGFSQHCKRRVCLWMRLGPIYSKKKFVFLNEQKNIFRLQSSRSREQLVLSPK